eukprot:420341_1
MSSQNNISQNRQNASKQHISIFPNNTKQIKYKNQLAEALNLFVGWFISRLLLFCVLSIWLSILKRYLLQIIKIMIFLHMLLCIVLIYYFESTLSIVTVFVVQCWVYMKNIIKFSSRINEIWEQHVVIYGKKDETINHDDIMTVATSNLQLQISGINKIILERQYITKSFNRFSLNRKNKFNIKTTDNNEDDEIELDSNDNNNKY